MAAGAQQTGSRQAGGQTGSQAGSRQAGGQPAASQAASQAAGGQPGSRSLIARLDTQPQVRSFLTRAVASGRASHAYLFVGPQGAGKLDAAWALAQALLCENAADGEPCGACDACVRTARRTHPDVHCYAPESATGYLIAQVRDLLSDVALTPIRARSKVYIVSSAEQLRANTANALLKTLEEPPEATTFILLSQSAETVLPTIVSRCQCVPFRTLPAEEATRAVVRETGLSEARCRMAVAVAGSPARAVAFLQSPSRQEARRRMVRAIDSLPAADEADILLQVARPKPRGAGAKGGKAAKAAAADAAPADLMSAIKAPFATFQADQQAILERNADYFSRGAIKQLEERAKRELSARERSGIMEALSCARSLLRDVLLVCEGSPEPIVNEDAAATVERLASTTTTAGAIRALEAVAAAEARIARNTSPQLTLEVMLFDIRKALTCP